MTTSNITHWIINTKTLRGASFCNSATEQTELKTAMKDLAKCRNMYKKWIETAENSKHRKNYIRWFKEYKKCKCRVVTWDELQELLRKKYLNAPPKEIASKRYWEMLEVLPPMFIGNYKDMTFFTMSEVQTCNYTRQFAILDDKYYEKFVDYTDKSTWIYNHLHRIRGVSDEQI